MSEQQRPSFGGQLNALLREGAKDLHNAIVPAFPTSRGVDEPGTPLSPTSQMVTADLGTGKEDKGYAAMLGGFAARAAPAESKQPDLER